MWARMITRRGTIERAHNVRPYGCGALTAARRFWVERRALRTAKQYSRRRGKIQDLSLGRIYGIVGSAKRERSPGDRKTAEAWASAAVLFRNQTTWALWRGAFSAR